VWAVVTGVKLAELNKAIASRKVGVILDRYGPKFTRQLLEWTPTPHLVEIRSVVSETKHATDRRTRAVVL
jgi:hypothetical protein